MFNKSTLFIIKMELLHEVRVWQRKLSPKQYANKANWTQKCPQIKAMRPYPIANCLTNFMLLSNVPNVSLYQASNNKHVRKTRTAMRITPKLLLITMWNSIKEMGMSLKIEEEIGRLCRICKLRIRIRIKVEIYFEVRGAEKPIDRQASSLHSQKSSDRTNMVHTANS